jgi:hypothetical protein
MKIHIYCNNYGRIVSIVEIKEDKEAPPAGVLSIPDFKEYEIELTDEQASMPLIALHAGYRMDLTQLEPRLVPLFSKRDKSENEPRSKE